MTTDTIDQVSDDAAQELAVRTRRARPTFGYYRMPNGWITVALVSPMERLAYMEEGWQELRSYGAFDMTTGYAAAHPFELLFMGGGAKELPAEQVIANGFHINPPTVPGCRQPLTQFHKGHTADCMRRSFKPAFDQVPEGLAGFPCPFCSRVSPTKEAAQNHEGVMHKDERNGLKTAEALAAANERAGTRMAEAVGAAIQRGLESRPAEPTGDTDALQAALTALAAAGLTKKQQEALAALGVELAPAGKDEADGS